MRVKLLVPFEIAGFSLRSEQPVVAPTEYADFWSELQKNLDASRIGLGDALQLRFTHATEFTRSTENRYGSIEASSLVRPLHLLEARTDSTSLGLPESIDRWRAAAETPCSEDPGPSPRAETAGLVRRLLARQAPVLVRVYGHRIGIVELDLPLGRHVVELLEAGHAADEALDGLQMMVVDLGGELVRRLGERLLRSLFREIASEPAAATYLEVEPETWAAAGREDGKLAAALWTTRTLIVEKGDDHLDTILGHWLKDVGGGDAKEIVQRVQQSATGYSMQWLNYAFREEAYPAPYPEAGWSYGKDGLARPFRDRWTAMIQSQYYYAAFDVVRSRIFDVLARSFAGGHERELRALKGRLDWIVERATLLQLDYHENFKFYERDIANEMKSILGGWGLDKILSDQLEKSVKACSARVDELHKRASERSSVYTDFILLGIGITSVFSILLTLIQQGRDTATNTALAAYERGYVNIIDWVASRSTDGILLTGAIISGALAGLYYYFKRQKIL